MKRIKKIIKNLIFRLPFIKNIIIERNSLIEENKKLKVTKSEIKNIIIERNSLIEENKKLKVNKSQINNDINKKDYEVFF